MAFTSFAGRSYNIVSDEVKQTDSFDEIPIIDLTHPQAQVVESLRDACTRVGFFYIFNHGIPQNIIDQVFSTAQEFFALDDKLKQQVHFKNGAALCGYEGFQNVYTDERKKPDLNEAFSWRYAPDMDFLNEDTATTMPVDADKANNFLTSGQNLWPDAKPEMRCDIIQYYSHVLKLARKLIRLFALVLELPETYFDEMMRHPPPKGLDPPFGIGAHTDIECFTILCQGSDVPALQVLNPKGEWILAPPIQGTFVVNIGDMLARWSNDTFRSTIHRVLNITGRERCSMPVFIGPSYNTVIKPLETCLTEGAKYDPIPAGLYVWKRLAISRLDKAEYERQRVKMESQLAIPIRV
ncbi:1-aminocyclopropane-1-carboxylate oxidase, putative [Talaromyces stipitatus ATCC 10500]|uniref:1-aminocyclopropane-1-carboxylate oxidase, putative n=1 Tax=Talaromyces stipitatus (strain ATCC 10500 / CBS 375.48 / QM 6759 / NRRL 1006) TaxID=441959 RepID=B8M7P0_TALSN|nr:1-aminocyclopropane-1-carboxylate oxidase, putative [Talaromyces stipitatus ATCC 10500]EED19593.1 1-aminocyclopropane-1-carboxylate oxidase, putative [Talaromyces stipitatus ATCC 10500]